ncbi:AAA family ATPase [Thalassospira sp. GO-4]|jgi:predicted ATPase|uniref:AAA family ATPase n=1 Tax=Thalassospira sp. GO-4 TaxID=2946605 RepID=UPI0020244EA8|nr:ATP-binding protein [Thalassospira sp. GO-4]URK19051.1 AAA family ATPase [Thalassospira sp. GO-4]
MVPSNESDDLDNFENLYEPYEPDFNTHFSIAGFRSLVDFEIKLTPGVNILVGPNGSGKTNFIEFQDFISDVIENGCSKAVFSAGGISRVFSQENTKRSSSKLHATIKGIADIEDSFDAEDSSHRFFRYEYQIEIRYSKKHSAIYIHKENLKIFKMHNRQEWWVSYSPVGNITVKRRSPVENGNSIWHLGSRLFTQNHRNPFHVLSRFYLIRNAGKTKNHRLILQSIRERIESTPIMPDESFLSAIKGIPALDVIRKSISRGHSFNPLPEKSRAADDLASRPGITFDGSGLSATLYHLQQLKRDDTALRRPQRLMSSIRRADKETLDMVIQWTKLVIPELLAIVVNQDPHSGKYLGYLVVNEAKPLRIPLQSASDGTLKWLALACLILSYNGVFSIEEPENFLHPKMQQSLISLIRETIEDSSPTKHFTLSTHSETLINQCRPDEIVIFEYGSNGTTCSKVRNPKRIEEEINRTGFGLGSYYASNALS